MEAKINSPGAVEDLASRSGFVESWRCKRHQLSFSGLGQKADNDHHPFLNAKWLHPSPRFKILRDRFISPWMSVSNEKKSSEAELKIHIPPLSPPHTHKSCYYHTLGEVLLIFGVLFFFPALLPHLEAAHEQFSSCLLMVFHKALWDIFYTSIRAIINLTEKAVSPAQPWPLIWVLLLLLSWHGLAEQGTRTVKGFVSNWA